MIELFIKLTLCQLFLDWKKMSKTVLEKHFLYFFPYSLKLAEKLKFKHLKHSPDFCPWKQFFYFLTFVTHIMPVWPNSRKIMLSLEGPFFKFFDESEKPLKQKKCLSYTFWEFSSKPKNVRHKAIFKENLKSLHFDVQFFFSRDGSQCCLFDVRTEFPYNWFWQISIVIITVFISHDQICQVRTIVKEVFSCQQETSGDSTSVEIRRIQDNGIPVAFLEPALNSCGLFKCVWMLYSYLTPGWGECNIRQLAGDLSLEYPPSISGTLPPPRQFPASIYLEWRWST